MGVAACGRKAKMKRGPGYSRFWEILRLLRGCVWQCCCQRFSPERYSNRRTSARRYLPRLKEDAQHFHSGRRGHSIFAAAPEEGDQGGSTRDLSIFTALPASSIQLKLQNPAFCVTDRPFLGHQSGTHPRHLFQNATVITACGSNPASRIGQYDW